MFLLLFMNFYFLLLVNSFISLFMISDLGVHGFYIFLLVFYFTILWVLFLFLGFYKIYIFNYVILMIFITLLNKFYIMFLIFMSLIIYFIFVFLFLINFFNKCFKTHKCFKLFILVLFFNFLLMSLYCFMFLLVSVFYSICFFNLFNLEDPNNAQTFFYFFKYDFKWLIIYAWGIPVLFCLVCQIMFLLFLLSSKGYDFSKNFGDNVSSWYYTTGFKELFYFHDVVYYPFKVMGFSFKFFGNYLDMSENESFLVYISSLFLIVVLMLFWMESLFFSMYINWFFLWFWEWGAECKYFSSLFKMLSKYLMIFSMLFLMFFNLFLVISSFFVIAFMFCFSGNLFINYEVYSGSYYEPMYFCSMDGGKYCMVTPSQFSVYHNMWFYNGIYWILEETEECKSISSGEFYGYLVKL